MIAGPGVLHEGYNSGENLAEAVNFAFPQWLRIISNVIPCTCFKYNLAIDVKQLYLTWHDAWGIIKKSEHFADVPGELIPGEGDNPGDID